MTIDHLNDPADLPVLSGSQSISNLMHIVWLSRPDLQSAFDLNIADGQIAFISWYESAALREYGLPPMIPGAGNPQRSLSPAYFKMKRVLSLGRKYFSWLPLSVRRFFRNLWLRLSERVASGSQGSSEGVSISTARSGANLIGYAHGVLGMGEHVRMTAEALAHTTADFGVFNFSVGVENRELPTDMRGNYIKSNIFKANIFHINADQMLNAYAHLGPNFFRGRYNIGYWAWELPKCPKEWIPVIQMVDEVWAPSRFIQKCFSEVTGKPVTFMPLCVELPDFVRRPRSYFDLPEGHVLFLYMFDFMSYIDRKNPFAAIHAFRQAFPDKSTKAGLVLKVMNADPDNEKWQQMLALISDDPRIFVLNKVMDRHEVLALVDCCDSFVSLHRSEGFGRGPAEAMYLGKPVIVTNFSGNTDFNLADNSLLVDYRLIDVLPDQYVFPAGQQWADADIGEAARHMRTVVEEPALALEIGARGQAFIRDNFSAAVTGGLMYNRLRALGLA